MRTLIDSFRYPRRGPGMMWDACAARVREMGNEVILGRDVTSCSFDGAGTWTVESVDAQGVRHPLLADHVISSAPLRQRAAALTPPLSARASRAAGALRYRDFLTVVLIVRDRDAFKDNWIYIHDPAVKVGTTMTPPRKRIADVAPVTTEPADRRA
jgi:protoporphyrinogen oxidase